MAEKARLQSSAKIILSEEHIGMEENLDHLMSQDVISLDENVRMQDEQDEEDHDLNTQTHDEVPKEDFFETKVEKEQKYGEIEGMTSVTEYDESTPRTSKEVAASDETNFPERIISKKHISIAELKDSDERIGSVVEDAVQKTERPSKVTIVEDRSYRTSDATDDTENGEDKESSQRFQDDITPKPTSSDQEAESERKQAYAHRRSIHYELARRMYSMDQVIEEFFDFGKQDDLLFMDELDEEVEEESEYSVIEEEVQLNREPYYEKYMKISDEIVMHRIRNNFLQKLVIIYLKRRKVENYAKDGEPPLDQVLKYGQKLDAYQELMEINKTQRNTISIELSALKEKKEKKSKELANLFKTMQTREANIGYGLIYAKTGNQISEKLVERLIRRQSNQIDQVSTMRLKYIKLKGMVQEKLDAIDSLDIVEDGLRLANYEQLKVENRSYADKIEEREEELARLRFKCQNTIQILAHLREKSAALDSDLLDLSDEFNYVDAMSKDLRGNLANLKQDRDKYRQMERKIKEESGLLTYPDLLRDMEASQIEAESKEIELIKCREEAIAQTKAVRNLRKHMEKLMEKKAHKGRFRKSSEDVAKGSKKALVDKDKATIYKGRPTLYMPTIKPNAFNDIVKIKPTLNVSSKRK